MLFKILHGDASRISTDITPFHEGYCYVTHDGYMYIDMNIGTEDAPNNQRVKLNAKEAEALTGYSVETILNSSDTEIPTSKAVLDAIENIPPTIIDVTELPTENIDTSVIYRAKGNTIATMYFGRQDASQMYSIIVVDELPSVGVLPDLEAQTTTLYFLTTDQTAYLYLDASLAEMLEATEGWSTFESFIEAPVSLVSSIDEIPEDDTEGCYILITTVKPSLFTHYNNGSAVEQMKIITESELDSKGLATTEYVDSEISGLDSRLTEAEDKLDYLYGKPSEGLAYTLSNDETYYIVSGIDECTDTDIKIPPMYKGLSVKEIGSSAFYGCKNLTSVVIPDSVISIGNSAFSRCSSLTSVVIGDSVTSIGQYAFYICTSLKSVTIPNSVTSIGDRAFCRCSSLESVVIGDSVTSIDDTAFGSCDNLTIYCEAESQPEGWNSNWNSGNRPVVWGAAIDFAGVNDQLNSVRAEITNMTPITYSELKSLRDNSELIPGMFYRITDYICTTSQENTRAMDNKFDIIVQALSANTLSESASADYHYEDGEPDGYFIKKVEAENALISDAVTKYYDIYEDCGETEDKTADYKNTDKFIAYGYLANNEGVTVPVLYKTDMSYAEEDEEFTNPDYGDTFYYVGTYELDGTTYDKWRKIEEGDYGWDGTGKIYALTNVIVEDNTIIDSVIDGSFIVAPKAANLPAWEIKYCLDNDTTRFAWAMEGQAITNLNSAFSNGQPLVRQPIKDRSADDGVVEGYLYAWGTQADVDDDDDSDFVWSKNPTLVNGETVYNACADGGNGEYQTAEVSEGKGIIYYMKDEHGNECPYDFKNIQFKRDTAWQEEHTSFVEDSLCLSIGDVEWFYTFSWVNEDLSVDDLTMRQDLTNDEGYAWGTHHNIIGITSRVIEGENGGIRLPNNVMTSSYHYDSGLFYGCYNNTFGNNCGRNTFVSNGCYDNTFGNYCYNNTLGICCNNITFGNYCSDNTLGTQCHSITFESGCCLIKIPSNFIKYIRVCQGVKGNGSSYKTITPTPNADYQQIYRKSGVQEIILD